MVSTLVLIYLVDVDLDIQQKFQTADPDMLNFDFL